MYNIVTVTFKDSNTATANGVRQWDYGQILRIQGLQLPTAVEVHFALIDSKDSVTRIGTTKDGVTDVVIPDSMIEAGKNIFAYVYLRDSESGQTEYEIKIVVTTRAKPEAFDTPEDKELFAQAIEAVNEAADRAEKAGQAATEAAGQAAEDAQQTAEDRKEVAKMVETVSDISEQVKKVEELSNKVQEAATKTGQDAQQTAEDRVEVGKMLETVRDVSEQVKSVEESVRKAKESEQAAAGHRTAVEEMKNSVEQTASTFPQKVQEGVQAIENAGASEVQEITQAGTAQKTAVEAAGTQAVESVENVQQVATEAVETAKTEAVQAVQAEGAKQIKEVQDKGAEVLQSIPEDFATQMETKLNKQQGIENKGKVLVIEEDGNVVPGEVASGGGDGIAIINTMSGESPLVIPDSAERVNKRLELGGKTEQVTTTGKNLANPSEFVIGTLAGDTGNIINLKQYITTGYIPAIPGKRYSTSCGNKFLAHTITAYDKEKTKINYPMNMSSEMPEGAAYIRLSYKKIDMANVTESDMEELKKVCMVNEGSKSISYEPYTGGKPSPSPEYPQEIKNSGKWNEETQKYEVDVKVSNKNLFDLKRIKNGFVKSTGNSFDIVEDNMYPKSIYLDIIIPLKAGQTLNISGVEQDACRIRVKHDTGNYYLKYTANKDTEIIICFYGGLTDENKKTILIEISDTPTNYEPYKEQTLTLTSDRPITKWDRLVEQGGEIGWLYKSKIIDGFDGQSSNITLGGKQGKVQHFSVVFADTPNSVGNANSYCDKYIGVNVSWTKEKFGIFCDWNNGVKFFSAPNENVATVDEFKAWLVENPLKIAYETTKTEFIPLPQSEQNTIRALKTYYPTTVITVDGGELYPDIKVTYTADTKNYIDGKVSAKVASILRQYQADTANLLSLMPMETQATMIENDTNNILNNLESEEAHE